eukprot:jgi/Orpsp1_1/1175611/evm.model.c7180000054509.1
MTIINEKEKVNINEIKKILNKNEKEILSNLKFFLNNSNVQFEIENSNNKNFDLLIYAIKNKSPIPVIEFIISNFEKYKISLNYETKQNEVPLFIAFEKAIPKQKNK